MFINGIRNPSDNDTTICANIHFKSALPPLWHLSFSKISSNIPRVNRFVGEDSRNGWHGNFVVKQVKKHSNVMLTIWSTYHVTIFSHGKQLYIPFRYLCHTRTDKNIERLQSEFVSHSLCLMRGPKSLKKRDQYRLISSMHCGWIQPF